MAKQIREVKIVDLITYALLPPVVVVLLWTLAVPALLGLDIAVWLIYTLVGLLSYVATRRFLIGIILLYKAFAPSSTRDACRFYPTCSTYMMMAINKYGIVIGLYKGIRRIIRCKPPNGGVDYP